ncbi:transcriptional repressor [candidate division GN15 bacterium]|uniref:Transcriptional repressor n=1 Tax=candidate division GN15 bacterium TaxID=2072418 RepID=A0A855XAA6_9BACT|nr:MAG: transcriptional repressor [candidate division GN15 bacterium]
MREFLKTKGFKMTPQRERIFKAFFGLGQHVTVDELYAKVRESDRSIGYATVWRNLKLICKVGLAEEVNLGDGVTRYDRITREPHGHLFCLGCKKLIEFETTEMVPGLTAVASAQRFKPEGFKIEITGYCEKCQSEHKEAETPQAVRW